MGKAKMAFSSQICINIITILCVVGAVEQLLPEYGQNLVKRFTVFMVVLTSATASLQLTPFIGPSVPDALVSAVHRISRGYVRSFVLYSLSRFILCDLMLFSSALWLNTIYSFGSHIWRLTTESMDSIPLFVYYVMLWMYVMPWIGALVLCVTLIVGFFEWVILAPKACTSLAHALIMYRA